MATAPTEVCRPEIRFAGQANEGTVQMIVIGADTHKSTHTFAAAEQATGRVLDEKTFAADQAGMVAVLRCAVGLDDGERVFALEDCRHVSGRLERFLVASGERVIRVAPKLMGQSRRAERSPGKSDSIDARAVAHAVLERGVDAFPAAWLDAQAMEIRLADHRSDLVAERTRMQSRLRWHLVELDADPEARLPAGSLDRTVWLDRVGRRMAAMAQTARVRVARHELRRVRELCRQVRALERELAELVAAHRPELLALPGCGVVSAATLIGRTAGAERFATDGHFARLAGVAPIPASSGRRDRQRLNRGGDRQLNAALHRIAVAQGRHHPPAKAYLERKQAEHKRRLDALRCLKRHLARRVWQLLRAPHPDQDTHTHMTKINNVNSPAPALALT